MAQDVPPSKTLPQFRNTQAIRRLLSVESPAAEEWLPDEFGVMLGHQLGTSLALGVSRLDAARGLGTQQMLERLGSPSITFFEALARGGATVEILGVVKWFAKECLTSTDPLLPWPIAVYLYVLSIVTALRLHGACISTTPEHKLETDLSWLAGQPWVSGAARGLVEAALAWLQSQRARA
ncbi:MAG: hypothetical protein SGI86_00820 [Deltaproteobacteria bacterium]|nr:hypothetical protein [Deltaproteobacteria bacterium]